MDDQPTTLSRFERWLMALAAMVLVGAWLIMGSASGLLGAMSPGPCRAGAIVDAQWTPSAATNAEMAETITGWILFERESKGLSVAPARCAPAAGTVGTETSAVGSKLRVHSPRAIARWWLLTDMVGFTPAYVALLWLLLRWAVVRRRRRQGDAATLSGWVRSVAAQAWLPALAVVGGMADLIENAQLLPRLGRWWAAAAADGQGVVSPAAVSLAGVRAAGMVKVAALALPVATASTPCCGRPRGSTGPACWSGPGRPRGPTTPCRALIDGTTQAPAASALCPSVIASG